MSEHIAVEFLLPLLVVAVVCACYTSAVAESKGHDSTAWFCGGLFLGPLALLASVGLPDLKLRKYLRLLAEHQGAIDPEAPSSKSGVVLSERDVQALNRKYK